MGHLVQLENCPPELVPWALAVADLAPDGFSINVCGYRAPTPEHPNSTVVTWTVYNAVGEIVGFAGRRLAECRVYVDLLPKEAP